MFEKLSILIVEDNPGDQRLTREAFQEIGVAIKVQMVSTGLDAIDFLEKKGEFAGAFRPHLIMMDLNLPKLSGRDVLKYVKESPDLNTIPVIIMSSSESDADISEVYKLKGNCYVVKPVDIDDYMKLIQSLVNFWFHQVRYTVGNSNSLK